MVVDASALIAILLAKTGPEGVRDLDDLLTAAAIRPVAVDAAQAHLARDGFQRYGKGQASAGLNLGDCFSYALATSMNRPLLFKGDDVGRTDIARAVI